MTSFLRYDVTVETTFYTNFSDMISTILYFILKALKKKTLILGGKMFNTAHSSLLKVPL